MSRRPWRRDEEAIKNESQTEQPAVPDALSIAPSQYWDGIDGPWSSFPIHVGSGSVSGAQQARVMVSTAATSVWTIGSDGCPPDYVDDCADSRGFLFQPNQSLTWTPNSRFQVGLEMNLGLDTSGSVGFDAVTLGWPGSFSATVPHTAVWNLADSNWWLGVFGLNPRPTNFTNMADPQTSFVAALYENGTIPSTTWAYTAGAKYRLNEVFGSLTLGGYDENRFEQNTVTFPMYEDISRDLSVYLQAIQSNDTQPSNLLPEESIYLFIDSSVPDIWLPESACEAFEAAFGISYDETWNRYLISSSLREKLLQQNATVTFTLGTSPTDGESVDIAFPYAAFDKTIEYPYIMNPNSSAYFPLRRAANSTQYTLGRTFLQEAYLIADYDSHNFRLSQCSWAADAVASPVIRNIVSDRYAPSVSDPAASRRSLRPATVAGIAVAAAVALGLLLGLGAWRCRRRRARTRALLLSADRGGSSDTDASSTRPVISAPLGGELGGNGLHEVCAWSTKRLPEMEVPYGSVPMKAGGSVVVSETAGRQIFEMPGTVFEMPGSEVYELAVPDTRRSRRWTGGSSR